MYKNYDKCLYNMSLSSTIPVFLVLITSRYTKIPRIDEIGHNLICKEKSLNRTNLCLSFYGGFSVIVFQLLLVTALG